MATTTGNHEAPIFDNYGPISCDGAFRLGSDANGREIFTHVVNPSPQDVEGLWCCGDSTFPGIGLPAVAASGMITSNSLASVWQHLQLWQDLGIA